MNILIKSNLYPTMKRVFLMGLVFTAFIFKAQAQAPAVPADVTALLQKNTCYTCHKVDKKLIGPSWQDVAKKKYAKKKFIELVAKPVPANWPGYPPMAPLPQVPKGDLEKIYTWVSTLAK
jgi:cytochrome c